MGLVLYKNNQDALNKINEAFNDGKRIAGVVEATGTGKSYVIMAYILNNLDKKILLIEPFVGIIEHFLNNLKKYYGNLDELTNLKIITYSKLTNYSSEKLKNLDYDVLILDEFHHIGAPVWGKYVNELVSYHNNMKIIGTTAYTIRDRNTPYVRDMALVDGFELFSNNIVYEYPLEQAIVDGILPNMIYKSAYVDLKEMLDNTEEFLNKTNNYNLKVKYQKEIRKLKKIIASMDVTKELIQKNVFMGSKWIYFCPINSTSNVNDIVAIQNTIKNYLLEMYNEDDIEFYTSISSASDGGKKARDAFYNDTNLNGEDVSHKIKIMFAINQYNEGIHAPNVDGVIMGRETKSDIVFYEQLGRCLCVRDNMKERIDTLRKYSLEELIKICEKRDILINENYTKEDIINLLTSPTIIDLAGNISYIQELQNNIINILNRKKKEYNHEDSRIERTYNTGVFANIEIINSNVYDLLKNINNNLKLGWLDYYQLAVKYYNEFKTLRIPRNFKTFDAINYDENGYPLGKWISVQRDNYRALLDGTSYRITKEQIELLNNIHMIWQVFGNAWDFMFTKAQKYYEEHGNLIIKNSYITKDGYNLGLWIGNQRHAYKYYLMKEEYTKENKSIPKDKLRSSTNDITKEQIDKLNNIGMIWDLQDYKWHEMYKLVVKYKTAYNNLDIPLDFKTMDGINYDKKGYNIGSWLYLQKKMYFSYYKDKEKGLNNKYDIKRINLLDELDLTTDNQLSKHFLNWLESYNVAKDYYEENGNLNVMYNDHAKENKTLNKWLTNQRYLYYKDYSLNDDMIKQKKIELLNDIGMIWNLEKNFSDNCKLFYEKDLLRYIDVDEQREVRLSNYDLKRKIALLEENNIPLVEENHLNTLLYLSYHKAFVYIKDKEIKLEKKLV